MPDRSLPVSGRRENAEGDAALVKAARRDPSAFAALYRRYVTAVYRYHYSRVGTTADAEDLTGQTFISALEGLPGYRERGSFASWLFTIAHNKVADYHRRRHTHLPLNEALDGPDGVEGPLAGLVHADALQRLSTLVGGLADGDQELLRLRFAGGLTYRQIGAVVGRSEGAVKMAVHRLLKRLEAEWEDTDE
jgi:RNA polymerase sigma-70 factor, ECF subfamily